MRIPADDELRGICQSLLAEGFSEHDWAEHEACDWFQTPNFCGGFDAGDRLFWASYWAPDGTEYWFSFSLSDAETIARGEKLPLEGKPQSRAATAPEPG